MFKFCVKSIKNLSNYNLKTFANRLKGNKILLDFGKTELAPFIPKKIQLKSN